MLRRLTPLLALLLVLIVASPAAALTTKREWRASMGSGGHATLDAWTNGTGTLSATVAGLKPKTTYRVQLRQGACGAPKTVLGNFAAFTTSASGAATITRTISSSKMAWVWWARGGKITLRLTAGSSLRCTQFGYTHATRVRIPAYGIDLAVVKGPDGYPYCNVAMYMKTLYQPGEPGISFIYAHARKGMFLPLLNHSKVNNGASMIGKLVYVYTTSSVRYTYRITKVRRHVRDISGALKATGERLWLQTSEGPNHTYPKLIIVADRIATDTVTYDAAHPAAHPKRC